MRATRAKKVLTCQCALRAYVLTCQHVLRADVLMSQRALRAYMLTCQRALYAIWQLALCAHVQKVSTADTRYHSIKYHSVKYQSIIADTSNALGIPNV